MKAHLIKTTIHIGGVYASPRPALVRTVLGSCVSACIFDLDRQIGGMNHFMLPDNPNQEADPARYGVHAMELLINAVMKLGGRRSQLKAKVFGGADLFGFGGIRIGTENAEFVRRFLAAEAIPITAERLGGTRPLAVECFTTSARVLVKALEVSESNSVAVSEQRFRRRLAHDLSHNRPDDITLF